MTIFCWRQSGILGFMARSLFLLVAVTAVAKAQSNVPQHFLFDGRAVWSSNFQSKLEQDLTTGSRVSVKFDDDLGITSAWGPQFRAIWKITAGNRIRFDYRRFERSGEKVTEREIQIDETIFPAGSRVGSSVGGDELRFSYAYLFAIGGDHLRLGPLVDVRRVTLDLFASAMRTNPDELLEASIKTDIWAGTIGAEFDSTLTEQLNVYGFVNWIGAGALDGTWDVEFGLRYFLTPWLGINGGYSYAGTKIVIKDPEGFLRTQTNNLFFGAALGF